MKVRRALLEQSHRQLRAEECRDQMADAGLRMRFFVNGFGVNRMWSWGQILSS